MHSRCMGCETRVRSGLTCGLPACEAALERLRELTAPAAREDDEFYGRVDAAEARDE